MDNKFTVINLDPDASLPQVHQLVQQLVWMIANKTISEGETLPNIREMGEFLGIHMHTVRAAYHLLEERNLVSIKPRAGTVVRKYEPFLTINQANQHRKSLIAVLIPEMNFFYDQIFRGIRSVADHYHYLPVAIPCGDEPLIAESAYADVSARDFLGVINISLGFSDDFYRNFNQDQYLDIPLVFIDDFLAVSHRIIINISDAMEIAISHLLEHGYEDIALINCPSNWPVGEQVLSGFQSGLRHLERINKSSVFNAPNFSHSAGVFCAEQILAGSKLPRALVATSDELAIGAMSIFNKHGLRVPDDIAVIGYGNIPLASSTHPPLTTTSLPLHAVGQQAMKTLHKILQGNLKVWEQHEFAGKLVLRESCGCLP